MSIHFLFLILKSPIEFPIGTLVRYKAYNYYVLLSVMIMQGYRTMLTKDLHTIEIICCNRSNHAFQYGLSVWQYGQVEN